MSFFDEFPKFYNEASCASAPNPDLWFPEEEEVMRVRVNTPEAEQARAICMACPARQECLDYSLQFSNLYGIWAGLDRLERRAEQIIRNLTPSPMRYAHREE